MISELRARQRRNFLVTLFLSQGVPMLLAGDEMGRSQGGNNNAYCQDTPVSWLDWSLAGTEQDLLQFTETLAGLRRDHPVFRRGGSSVADPSTRVRRATSSGSRRPGRR